MDKTEFTEAEYLEIKKSAEKKRKITNETIDKAAPGLAKELTDNPELYLTFGVYWWGIKNLLIEKGQKGWWSNRDFPTDIPYEKDLINAYIKGMMYRKYNAYQVSHDHYRLSRFTNEPTPYFLMDEGCPEMRL